MGRPKGPYIKIDPKEVMQIAKTGATQGDLALRLGVSIQTVERRLEEPKYREAWLAGRGELNISLRAKQIQVALGLNNQGLSTNTPSVPMLIWLGEQLLGQSRMHRVIDSEGKDMRAPDANPPIELFNDRITSIIERRRALGGSQ